MKSLRLAVFASVLALLTGCPKGDKCASVTCPSGQSCDPSTGACVNGSVGGGTGGNGGNGGNGGGTGGGTIDAGPPIPLSELCDRLAQTQCDKLERCTRLDAAEKAACLALVKDGCTIPRDVNGMVATYDPAKAAECLAGFAAADCADNRTPPACSQAVVGGRGQANSPCLTSSNCQADAGLYCRTFNGCGACTAFAGSGQFCTATTPSVRCASGFTCLEPNNDGGTCVGPRLPGETCNFPQTCLSDAGFCGPTPTDGGSRYCQPFGAAGARCTTTTNCLTGLFCNTAPGDGGASLCEAQRGTDQPCPVASACQPGLYCNTTTPRTCKTLLADGQPCTTDIQCAADYCNRDPFSIGFDGGPRFCGYLTSVDFCYLDDDCGPGKFCKDLQVPRPDAGWVAGNCAGLDPDGGACTNSESRFADSCANTAATCLDSKCVVTPPFSRTSGQTCDNYSQCGGGSHCDFADPYTWEGHCTTMTVAIGGECKEDVACGDHNECYIDFFSGGPGSCMALAHRGETCDYANGTGPDCSQYLECLDNLDGGDPLCVPYVGPGESCNNFDGPFCYGSFCKADAGTCTTKLAQGESCTSNAQCTTGRCRNADAGFSDLTCLAACY